MSVEQSSELGGAHATRGDWAAAKACFEAALAAEPGLATLWANLALAATRSGDVDTAEGALQIADTLAPERAGEWREVLASGQPLPAVVLGPDATAAVS